MNWNSSNNTMKLFLIVYSLLQITCVISSENATAQNNSILLTKTNVNLFKNQVNKIGMQAENFVIDLFSQLLNSTFNGQVTVNSTHNVENDEQNNENSDGDEIVSRKRRNTRNMEILNEPPPPQCKPSDTQRKLERIQLTDLKREVDNLRDLILLLRDQQKIVDLLKHESQNSEHLLPKTSRENIKTEIINELKPKQSTFVQFGETHEELEKLKFDLKSLVASLNETRQVLANERTKERQLELELGVQRKELTNLKSLVGTLLANETTEPIVGAPLKLPTLPSFPTLKPPTIAKKNVEKPQTRASGGDTSDIRRILALIAKNEKKQESNGDILDKIKGLQDELENREKNDDLLKQLVVIERLLKQNGNENAETKTLDDDSGLLKKLLKNLTTEKQSKTDEEENLLSELRNLQTAIKSLRPPTNDNFEDLDSRSEQEQFQFMLNKLISGQAGRPRRPRPQIPSFIPPIDSGTYANPVNRDSIHFKSFSAPIVAPPYTPLPYYNVPAYFPPKVYENAYQPRPEIGAQTNQYDWSQFFQGPPANSYNSQPYSSPYPSQLPPYPPANSAYDKTKIDDLKTEIFQLQSIIQNLNQPGYAQNPADKQAVYNLETQINDLRNVIGSMTADTYQQSAPVAPPQPQPQPVPNYEPKASRASRMKRSIDDNQVDSAEDNQQLEAFTTMLQKVFPVNEENDEKVGNNQKEASRSGMYGQIREQLDKIRNQLGMQLVLMNISPEYQWF